MTPQLEVSVDGALGIMELNRPEAINALSREMIAGISETLEAWRDDAGVRVVLFEGRGARGFCSGGDVRAVRAAALDNRLPEADAYFAEEYAMNLAIATYAKPIAVIGHGAVMGGGIGIAGHARFRFAVSEARFAMPEAAIGFVSDVGVNAILAEAPEPRALAFLMAGLPAAVGDALKLGLCDTMIGPERLDTVRRGIGAAATQDNPETALVMLMQSEGIEAGEATLCGQADGLAEEFSLPTAAEIVAAISRRALAEPSFERLAATLQSRSPSSLEAILQSHRAARRRPEIGAVLAQDLRLAHFMVRQPDFAEGVRAVLVDKDQHPRWPPEKISGTLRKAIGDAIRS